MVFLGRLSIADSGGIIKYRKNVMKTNAGHMGAITDILKNRLPLEVHVVDHARSIYQNSKMTLTMFPRGTHDGNTKAKLIIWEKWSEFEAASEAFVRESEKLLQVAENGDMKAFAKQIRTTGKSCGACHKHFKEK